MQQSELEALADEIQDASLYRLSRPEDVPIRRNPFRHRKTPRTDIISEACRRKYDDRTR
jgi:hypothetical protein